MLEKLKPADFQENLGSLFRVDLEAEGKMDLVLVEVTRLKPDYGQGPREEPFAVLFRGPRTAILPQRTYRIENEKMGTLDVFIVPVGPDAQGMRYEAVFN
jgi:hypothetical protein